jgi:hypothetical protein
MSTVNMVYSTASLNARIAAEMQYDLNLKVMNPELSS